MEIDMIQIGDKYKWTGEDSRFYTKDQVYEVMSAPDEFGMLTMTFNGQGPTEKFHWSVDDLAVNFERVGE